MANTLAQNPTVATYSNATSVNKTFASACTNPSLIVARVSQEQAAGVGAATFTVSDDGNAGNYTQDVTRTHGDSSNPRTDAIYSIQNTATSALTVTAALSAARYGILKIDEMTGAATSSALDTTASAGNNPENVASSPSMTITPTTANATILVAGGGYPNVTGADTNFTSSYSSGVNNQYHYGEHRVDAGAAAGNTVTWNSTGSTATWNVVAAAYKTFAGGDASASLTGTPSTSGHGTVAPGISVEL